MHDKAKYYMDKIGLEAHPEGGYFKEIYRSKENIIPGNLPERYEGGRNFSTSIYFLLEGEQKSNFHRIKSDEIWHFYDGSPVKIYIISNNGKLEERVIGQNFENGERYQEVIEKNSWFAAEVIDKNSFALMGCTVAPGFDFRDFELGKREELEREYPKYSELIRRFTSLEEAKQ